MKAFVAYSSIVVKSRKSFFMRSKDSKLKGIRQVFIKRSTKSLKEKEEIIQYNELIYHQVAQCAQSFGVFTFLTLQIQHKRDTSGVVKCTGSAEL